MTGPGGHRTIEVCAVLLAAGEGRRLRPLTEVRPKALCPVGNVPLLEQALARIAAVGFTGPDLVAVNACHLAGQIVAYVGDRATLSVEPGTPLGTSGGVANLKHWIDGRAVLVGNADAYLAPVRPGPDIATLLTGWDGETVRLLGVPAAARAEFGSHRFAGFSLLPWDVVAPLPAASTEPGSGPTDLVRTVWRPVEAAGRLEVIEYPGLFVDSGTPYDYLAANLHAAGSGSLVAADATVTGRIEHSVIGAGAVIAGTATRCVVWPDGYVDAGEQLSDAVRVGRTLTVPAGPPGRR